jgi:hypothetical protein
MFISKRIKALDNFLCFVDVNSGIGRIMPTNILSRKKRFLKTHKDPIFQYDKTFDLSKLNGFQASLKEIHFSKSSVEKILDIKRKHLIKKLELAKSIGSSIFTKASLNLFPAPEKSLINISYKLLELPSSSESTKILRKDLTKKINNFFKQNSLKWKVRSREMIASAAINNTRKVFYFKKRERFTASYFRRLFIHEIGTHIFRYENGLRQPLKVFSKGFPSSLETEEGLAAYNELTFGVLRNDFLKNYAGRVLAINFALDYGFKKTYFELRKFFTPEQAFKLTTRAKRGLSKTSKSGAYTKDLCYLRGLLKVSKFLQKNKIEILYSSKVGLKELHHLKNFRIKEPNYLPKLLNLEEFSTPLKDAVTKDYLESLSKKFLNK